MTKFNVFFFASGFWIYIVLGLVLVLVPGDYMLIFNLPNTPFIPKTNPKKNSLTDLRSDPRCRSIAAANVQLGGTLLGGEVIEGLVM